jgi:hypothetical protein
MNVFPLEAKHAELECAACHQNGRFGGTPDRCVDCHLEPEIHMGSFGVKCEYCHTATAWAPAFLSFHPFPLAHGSEVDLECTRCHVGSYQEFTCFGCHEHQEATISESHVRIGIPLDQVSLCFDCHPAGLIEEVVNDENITWTDDS